MLKKRLIPTLLLQQGRMIKSVKFTDYRDVGNPVTAAKVYNAQDVDELVFLDISASTEGRASLFEIIDQVAFECFMPMAAGGGIKELAGIRQMLRAGADKVVINTAALERSEFIDEAVREFGQQCIVISIDVRKGDAGKYRVFSKGGAEDTGREALAWVREACERGAGEIMITSIDRDGTMEGYDLALVEQVVAASSVPVIASGGAGTLQDLVDVIADAGASAASAASIFHFTDQSPIKAKFFMQGAKLPVRQQ